RPRGPRLPARAGLHNAGRIVARLHCRSPTGRMRDKLGLTSRAQAVVVAYESGLVVTRACGRGAPGSMVALRTSVPATSSRGPDVDHGWALGRAPSRQRG